MGRRSNFQRKLKFQGPVGCPTYTKSKRGCAATFMKQMKLISGGRRSIAVAGGREIRTKEREKLARVVW